MYVVATNVLSETMKASPAPLVAEWLDRQRADLIFTTVISKAKILAGIIAVMPAGRRKQALERFASTMFGSGFRDRILSFDDATSADYAHIAEMRRQAGRPIGMADLIIAAITRRHSATVVTRDVGGFAFTGVPVLSPWVPI